VSKLTSQHAARLLAGIAKRAPELIDAIESTAKLERILYEENQQLRRLRDHAQDKVRELEREVRDLRAKIEELRPFRLEQLDHDVVGCRIRISLRDARDFPGGPRAFAELALRPVPWDIEKACNGGGVS
jgi:chromosome segregation ATPase